MSEETVAKRGEPKTIRDLLAGDQFKLAVSQSLPKHLSADRFVRIAITAMTRQPKLAQCEQSSFFNCLLTLSQLGLEPDGRRAHLIPFENRKRNVTECQLIVDYKGIVDLVMRSGQVSNIHSDLVCENDDFDYDRGEIKRHKIDFKRPRGAMYAVYSLVRFKDGTEKSEVMTKDEVESVRRRSRAANDGPWVSDFGEMAKKTCFRRLSKWITWSPELRDAVEADDEALEDKRFAAALPVGSSFELPPSGPTFTPVKKPKAEKEPEVSKAKTSDRENVPDDSGLSSVSVPEKVDEAASQPVRTIQDDLQAEVAKVQGATFETFRAVAVALGWISADKPIEDFSELSDSTARKLYGARVGLAKALMEAVAKGIV